MSIKRSSEILSELMKLSEMSTQSFNVHFKDGEIKSYTGYECEKLDYYWVIRGVSIIGQPFMGEFVESATFELRNINIPSEDIYYIKIEGEINT